MRSLVTDVLVLGASGLLGQHLLSEARARGHDPLGTYMEEFAARGLVRLNLSDLYATVKLLRDRKPATVLLAAAMTSVDGCESHLDQAKIVNADAPREIAKACATLGSRLVLFSTDYVFDGRKGSYAETADPKPINVYGRTKLEGERAALAAHPGALVIRTSANFGWNRMRAKENSVTWVLGRLRKGEAVPLFTDQRISPSYVPEVARLMFELLDRKAKGVFHVATRPSLTRYEIGEAVCEVFRLPKKLLQKSRLEDADLVAKRPRDSSLSTRKLERFLHRKPLTFRDSLKDMRETE